MKTDPETSSNINASTRQTGWSAAIPLTFSGTVGLFQPPATGSNGIAVLFLSPWGLEEMCIRKFWRVLAEELADNGFASLRFDYPGAGDALDLPQGADTLQAWQDSIVAAAGQLRNLSGCRKLIVVSQGLGTWLGARTAKQLAPLEGFAFLAPVLSGRMYLRELAMWSKMIDDGLGLREDQRNSGDVAIAGLVLPPDLADTVRKSHLLPLEHLPATRCLVAARPGRPMDSDLVEGLHELGADVTALSYEGYDALVSNPTVARIPESLATKLVEWVKSANKSISDTAGPVGRDISVAPLCGSAFSEHPVRFGENGGLSGIFCQPAQARKGATVIFLTTAYDRHAGWGRSTAAMARQLAGFGIPSLRFDTAGSGDSPPVSGSPAQVLYNDIQNADVSAAVDFIENRIGGPVIVAGRCSGAYLAFRSALADRRIAGIVPVNPYTFYWPENRPVDNALQTGARSLGDYGQRLLQTDTFRRLLRGEVDIKNALLNVGKAASKRASVKLMPLIRARTVEGKAVYTAFRSLKDRNIAVVLLYSENDIGLEHFDRYFGPNGTVLSDYPNVSLTMIPDADHNLTPDHARAAYLDAVKTVALRFPQQQPQTAAGTQKTVTRAEPM